MTFEAPEPVRYIWVVDGIPTTGTISDYAKAWENAYYAGTADASDRLLVWDGTNAPAMYWASIRRDGMDEDDYLIYEITVNNEVCRIRIDGRA
jgi:hypothetical protein